MTLKRSLSVAGQRQSAGIRNEKAGGERKEMNQVLHASIQRSTQQGEQGLLHGVIAACVKADPRPVLCPSRNLNSGEE